MFLLIHVYVFLNDILPYSLYDVLWTDIEEYWQLQYPVFFPDSFTGLDSSDSSVSLITQDLP